MDFTKRQLVLHVAGLILLCSLGAVFGARVLAPGVSDDELAHALGDALVENCEANLVYRKQARERSIANDLSTKLQISANEVLDEVVHEIERNGTNLTTIALLGKKLDRVNAQLGDVRAESTALLPLPDCSSYRDVIKTSG